MSAPTLWTTTTSFPSAVPPQQRFPSSSAHLSRPATDIGRQLRLSELGRPTAAAHRQTATRRRTRLGHVRQRQRQRVRHDGDVTRPAGGPEWGGSALLGPTWLRREIWRRERRRFKWLVGARRLVS